MVERGPIAQQTVKRLQRLAWLWDSAFRIPGTRIRLGLDPIVGLVPGLGDALGAVVSAYIVLEAARCEVPASMLLRMLVNIAIDTLVGTVPVIGDVFDVAWRSNLRNVALIEHHTVDPKGAKRASRIWLALVIMALFLCATLGIAMGWFLVRRLLRLI